MQKRKGKKKVKKWARSMKEYMDKKMKGKKHEAMEY